MPGIDSYTKLMLHFNGTDESQTILDSSGLGNTITVLNHAKIDSGQYKFGNTSGYFDGTDDALTIPDNDTYFNFAAGDFTIDCWIYPSSVTNYRAIVSQRKDIDEDKAYFFGLVNNKLYFSYTTNGDDTAVKTITSVGTIAVNTWTHVAIVRNETRIGFYINGELDVCSVYYCGTDSIWNSSNTLKIAVDDTSAKNYYQGWIDELRISKGIARWPVDIRQSSAYTADANDSLLLHFDGTDESTTFIDSSADNRTITPSGNAKIDTAQIKFGSASGYFDGDGDSLSVLDDDDFAFGNGNFTIDAWIYTTDISGSSGYRGIFTQRTSTSAGKSFVFSLNNNKLYFSYSTNGTATAASVTSAATLANDTWNHVVVIRIGTTVYLIINGYVDSNTLNISTATLFNSSANPLVGLNNNTTPSEYFKGWIDELRVSKGVARTFLSFSVPTSEYCQDKDLSANINISANTSKYRWTSKAIQCNVTILASVPNKDKTSGGSINTPKEIIAYIDILGLIPRLIEKSVLPNIEISGTIPRDTTKTISNDIEVSGNIPRDISKFASSNISLSAEIVRLLAYNKELTGNIEVLVELLKGLVFSKELKNIIKISGSIDRLLDISKDLNANIEISGNIPRMIDRYITGNVGIDASILRLLALSKDITGYIDVSGSIGRDIVRDIISSILITGYSSGAGTKNKELTANLEIVGSILRNLGLSKIITSDVVIDGYSQRSVTKNINGYIDIDSNISRLLVLSKLLTGSVDISVLISRDISKYMDTDISIIGYINRFKTTPKILISNTSILGNVSRGIGKIIVPQVTVNPVIVRELMKYMSSNVSIKGYKSLDVGQILTALVSMYGYVGGAEADLNRVIGIAISIIDKSLGITLTDKTTGLTITDKDMGITLIDKGNGLTIADKSLGITIK